MKKKFKSIQEQKEYLITNKNVIDNNNNILDVLSERTYVSLINPFKSFFYTSIELENNHIYDNPTDFSEFIKLSSFDDHLGSVLHKKIGYIERKLKLAVAYEYSLFLNREKNDDTSTYYFNKIEELSSLLSTFNSSNDFSIFDPILSDLGLIPFNKIYYRKGRLYFTYSEHLISTYKYRLDLLISLKNFSLAHEQSQTNKIIHHYIDVQGTIPFWILVHQISFGQLIAFCNMLNNELRSNIYKRFNSYDSDSNHRLEDIFKFYSQLDTIRNIRNTVNHYEPLIIRLKQMNIQKLNAAVRLINETFNTLIVPKYDDYNFTSIERTQYNQVNLDLLETLKGII